MKPWKYGLCILLADKISASENEPKVIAERSEPVDIARYPKQFLKHLANQGHDISHFTPILQLF